MESSIIAKMRVPDLKNRLIELGLESKGLKAVLVARLNEYYETCRRQRLMTRNDDKQESEDDEKEIDEVKKTSKDDLFEESAEEEDNKENHDEENDYEENDEKYGLYSILDGMKDMHQVYRALTTH
jgi:hypothetical protein